MLYVALFESKVLIAHKNLPSSFTLTWDPFSFIINLACLVFFSYWWLHLMNISPTHLRCCSLKGGISSSSWPQYIQGVMVYRDFFNYGYFGTVDPIVFQRFFYFICPLWFLYNFHYLKLLLYLITFSGGNYIMAGFPKLGFLKELQENCENRIRKMYILI